MRAVRHPSPGAPWPLTAADGTATTQKDPACVLAYNKLSAMARDNKLRAGPTPGIADACSHPENTHNFKAGYTWALENKARYMKELAEQSEDYQRAQQLKAEQTRRQIIDATLKTCAAGTNHSPSSAGCTEKQHPEDEDGIAFGLFEQEYSGAVHACWSSDKASVRRAGGTGPLLQQVWARLPPRKRSAYRLRASKIQHEQQRLNNPEFQLAMQQTNPASLSSGSSASIEVSINWMDRTMVNQPARDRRLIRSRSAGMRRVRPQPASGSRSVTMVQPAMVSAVQSEGTIVRPTSAPSVALQISASTIDLSSSCDSSWFDDGKSRAGQRKDSSTYPALLRHCQNASMRIAGHHGSANEQRDTVKLQSPPPVAPRMLSPEKGSVRAGAASGTSGTASAPAFTKFERGSSSDGSGVPATKAESEERDDVIRYWKWKASEGRTTPRAHAAIIHDAIHQAKDRLSRPNTAGSSISARTPASVGLVKSLSQSSEVCSESEMSRKTSNAGQGEPAWSGPGVDGTGMRSASVSDMGRKLDAMPQKHSPTVAGISDGRETSVVEWRPSVEMATHGFFARRRDKSGCSPPQSPSVASNTHMRPPDAASTTAKVVDNVEQHEFETTTANGSSMDLAKGRSKRAVVLAVNSATVECSSQTSSSCSSDMKSSSLYHMEGQVQSVMESLRNYSSVDMGLVVRHHVRDKPHRDTVNTKAVSVGSRLRQRAGSRRESAAVTRVAEARRLLHCIGGRHYSNV